MWIIAAAGLSFAVSWHIEDTYVGYDPDYYYGIDAIGGAAMKFIRWTFS